MQGAILPATGAIGIGFLAASLLEVPMRPYALLGSLLLFSITAVYPALATQVATPAPGYPDLSAAMPLPLTSERRAAFEAYVAEAMVRFGVPGAAIAVGRAEKWSISTALA